MKYLLMAFLLIGCTPTEISKKEKQRVEVGQCYNIGKYYFKIISLLKFGATVELFGSNNLHFYLNYKLIRVDDEIDCEPLYSAYKGNK